ncbi:uncharacterized protein LOC113769069 [Coffea eugenioides]|uniref:uncharacterized protein LOC113769069 n=1 Tax=Coffea eugenioides TaxID=49369 RepID=UPI000F60E875|nr:uncharacterized protein LOC113769069 [Coffea eugenioides]
MKQSIFMRVLFCKIHCPFICLCKPSAAAHLYNSGPLKLESTPPEAPSRVVSVSDSSDQSSTEAPKIKKEEDIPDGKEQVENVLKSCMKKAPTRPSDPLKEVEKKRVQWMDNLGKELVETKEFESRYGSIMFDCHLSDQKEVLSKSVRALA